MLEGTGVRDTEPAPLLGEQPERASATIAGYSPDADAAQARRAFGSAAARRSQGAAIRATRSPPSVRTASASSA